MTHEAAAVVRIRCGGGVVESRGGEDLGCEVGVLVGGEGEGDLGGAFGARHGVEGGDASLEPIHVGGACCWRHDV